MTTPPEPRTCAKCLHLDKRAECCGLHGTRKRSGGKACPEWTDGKVTQRKPRRK